MFLILVITAFLSSVFCKRHVVHYFQIRLQVADCMSKVPPLWYNGGGFLNVWSTVRSAKWTVADSCRSSSAVSSWSVLRTDGPWSLCCTFPLCWSTGKVLPQTRQQSRPKREWWTHLTFQNCLDLDAMVKQRRIRARSCCATVAPLCCRRGPLKVSPRPCSTHSKLKSSGLF